LLYSLTINLILVGLIISIWVDWDDFVRPVNKLLVIVTNERRTDEKKKTNIKYYNNYAYRY